MSSVSHCWQQVERGLHFHANAALLPLAVSAGQRRLTGRRERRPIVWRGRDVAAKPFKSPASRPPINEVLEGGNISGREGRGFVGRGLWESVCFGWVPLLLFTAFRSWPTSSENEVHHRNRRVSVHFIWSNVSKKIRFLYLCVIKFTFISEWPTVGRPLWQIDY